MGSFSFLSRGHEVVDPIVLEVVLVGVETLWFGNNFNFPIIVRCTSIGGNDSSLEVGMHEVSATIILDSLRLLLVCALLALVNGRSVEHLLCRCLQW